MALITWNDGLCVGVTEIDRQHKKLIGMINELDEATRAGHGRELIGEIVDGLIIYTATHFRLEEKYFSEFEYADGDVHKAEHGVFLDKVDKLAAELDSASAERRQSAISDLLDFLGMWWKFHILETDMKYAKLFRDSGLK